MTIEKTEVKRIVSMSDIAVLFGLEPTTTKNQSCPFGEHEDKTPSFRLYPESFYCFSCGIGGDCIKLVQMIKKLSFQAALKFICEVYHIQDNTNGLNPLFLDFKRFIKWRSEEMARLEHAGAVCIVNNDGAALESNLSDREKLLDDEYALNLCPSRGMLTLSVFNDYFRQTGKNGL